LLEPSEAGDRDGRWCDVFILVLIALNVAAGRESP